MSCAFSFFIRIGYIFVIAIFKGGSRSTPVGAGTASRTGFGVTGDNELYNRLICCSVCVFNVRVCVLLVEFDRKRDKGLYFILILIFDLALYRLEPWAVSELNAEREVESRVGTVVKIECRIEIKIKN
ncbi:hypothetical protein EVAR_17240_1 [Eumeta japonica]|uniref:Uncharacterized protein n=1 Tax=Eumeta variegata TaxID=151549 RepID=A0A4C1TSW8_EUMVA|nr:hypothetical protein EVAR_17240_1 [Eumeta japonica]